MSRKLGLAIQLSSLAIVLSACGSPNEAAPTKTVTRVDIPDSVFKPVELEKTVDTLASEISKTAPGQLQLGVFLKNLDGYWEPVKVGANRAFGELGVSGVVLATAEGTEEENRNAQLALLEERENAGYDGFGIAPLADNVESTIDTIADSGTPVVTIDSDLVDSKRQLYIGTIN